MGKEKLLDAMAAETKSLKIDLTEKEEGLARMESRLGQMEAIQEELTKTKVLLSDMEEAVEYKGQEVSRQEGEILELEANLRTEQASCSTGARPQP